MAFFRRQTAEDPAESERRRVRSPEATKNRAVFSYYQNRSEPAHNPRQRSRSVKHLFRNLPTLVAVIVLVISFGYSLTLSHQPRIVLLNEQKSAAISKIQPSTEEYKNQISKILSKSVFNGNKLTLNTESVESTIQDRYPEITDVAVVLPLLGRNPSVYIQVAEPVLILKAGNAKYIIDEKGRVISQADAPAKTYATLIAVTDESGVETALGKTILTEANVAFIQEFAHQLSAAHLPVASMRLPKKVNDLYIQPKGLKYFIKATLTGEAKAQAGTFLATKRYLEKRGDHPASYVDVRVEERAYYK